jgi:hypothetical protein
MGDLLLDFIPRNIPGIENTSIEEVPACGKMKKSRAV